MIRSQIVIFRLHTASLLQMMRSTDYASLYKSYYRLRPSLKCDDFSALFYISNVNGFVDYVSLLNNETFAVM